MKKILALLFVFSLLWGCQNKKQVETLQIEGVQTITYEELVKNLDSNVRFLLYIGRPDCGDCQEFKPILDEYIKNHPGTGIYYLNIKEFRDASRKEDASQEEKDFYKNLYQELHFDWTPTIHEVSHGDFIHTYQYLDEDYFKIEDRHQQKQRRQEFLDEFKEFMDAYYKEDQS